MCVLLLQAGTARGQNGRPFAVVSAMLSTQGSERPGLSPSFPRSGVGGTAVGATIAVGGALSPTLSIAFEASIPARFESVQETDYFSIFRTTNNHRDVILSGLFHMHVPETGRIAVAVVAGPSVIREDTLQATAFQMGSPAMRTGNFGPYGPERSLTRWTVGITSGVDVDVAAGRHLSIVPQLRFHWIERADSGHGDSGFLGLSPWIWRPAIGVRARF